MKPFLLVLSVPLCTTLLAQQATTGGRGARATQRFTFGQVTKILDQFDQNKDGRLDRKERNLARVALKDGEFARGRSRISRMFGGDTALRPTPLDAAHRIEPNSVAKIDGHFYDQTKLRTLFLEFEQDDWFDELTDFYRTDVEVPATLVVDGKAYEGVGVRFRGSSSYLMVGRSVKKPFNITVDYTDPKARLGGYKTLNLLNGNQDSSFMRETVFAHVAQAYIPAPHVNYVKLVINGENWGIYQNAQQFNREFLKDAFGTKGGVRWKVLRNTRGAGALTYRGDDPASYGAYDLRTTSKKKPEKDKAAWQRLINLCKVLNQTSTEELPAELPKILNIDSVLWFCALENAFLPSDGYMNQGYDYRLYEDKSGRFHLVSHDCNEILQTPAGNMFRSRAAPLDATPLQNANNRQRPVLNRLLAVPEWRARYLAHLRTITMRWLTWETLGPVCHGFQKLIGEEMKADTKKLFSNGAFTRSLEKGRGTQRSLQSLVEERRQHILSHSSMRGPWPKVTAFHGELDRQGGRRLRVKVTVGGVKPNSVLLHYGIGKRPRFESVALHDDGKHGDGSAGDGIHGGTTPELGPKRAVRFYVEVRGEKGTVFHPQEAESQPFSVR